MTLLGAHCIVSLGFGVGFGAALSDAGYLFTWGANDKACASVQVW
jgi:hypothetical protein